MRVGTIVSLGASAALGLGALVVARMWLPSHAASAAVHPAPVVQGVPVVLAAWDGSHMRATTNAPSPRAAEAPRLTMVPTLMASPGRNITEDEQCLRVNAYDGDVLICD